MKKNSLPLKIGFAQDYGIVPGTMIVTMGLDITEVKNLFVKTHTSRDASYHDPIKWFSHIEDDISTAIKSSSGSVFFNNDTNSCILQMKNYNWSLSTVSILVHELNHVVEDIANNLGFQNEMEFKAYLQEYLFLEITQKLVDHNKESK